MSEPLSNSRENIAPVALVTGAARRIGRAIALDLARTGWSIAVHCHHSRDDAEAVVASIVAAGGRAVVVAADLTDRDQVASLVPQAVDALGPLGCLVNNASVFERDGALDATAASWDLHLETNLHAPFTLAQAFAHQLGNDAAGVVINMLDQRVWKPTAHFLSYTVSKTGLWTLTQVLALALAPRVRVNAIGPGPTLPSSSQSQAHFDRQVAALPLERRATSEDICRAVRFILEAPAMTGQMIALDGGQHLG